MKFFLLGMLLSTTSFAGISLTPMTEPWNQILKSTVALSGGVDYVTLEKNVSSLDKFLESHRTLDVKSLSDQEKTAVYINLYNAFMMKSILAYANDQKIAVKSDQFTQIKIADIKYKGGTIWNGNQKVNLAGVDVNLDEIEHGLIRGEGKGKLAEMKVGILDPRIHSAVNCAALSCPRVREIAYAPENLNDMLDSNMKEYLNSSSQFKKISEAKLEANSIVLWYYSDFDSYAQKTLKIAGAGDYLAKFIDTTRPDSAWMKSHLQKNFNDRSKTALRLSSAFSFNYNWLINDKRNKK